RTYERKIRETITAARVESTLSKDQILELYLNSVYLGRGSWGIERAARNYFNKSASELTVEEGALLAGLTKGPNYFSPDRHPGRAQERLPHLLSRVAEGGASAGGSPTCSAGCRRMARSRPSSPAGDCPRCRRSCPTNVRAATPASTSSIRSRARQNRLPESTRSRRTPTRCAPP